MPTRYRLETWLYYILSVPMAVLLQASCAAQPARDGPSPASRPADSPYSSGGIAPPAGTIDPEALLQDLRSFENAFQSLVETTSDSIADRSADPQVQRACVLWRTRVLTEVTDAISSGAPVVALMETWGICLRMRDYLATGQGAKLFGAHQPKAVDAARHALAMIEDVASRHMAEAQRKAALQEVQKYASQSPYTGTFDTGGSAPMRMDTPLLSGVRRVIGLPLAPFMTAQKVNQGVDYIKDWGPTVSRLTDVIEDYPRSVRWQADRLLLDLDRTPSFKQAFAGIDRVSETAEQLSRTVSQFQPVADRYADIAETLPGETARQVQLVLEALDRNQIAQSTTRSLDRISASSEQLIVVAQSLPGSVQQALDRSSQSASVQGRDLVDHIAWRAAQLLVLACLLAASLILLSRFLRPRDVARPPA